MFKTLAKVTTFLLFFSSNIFSEEFQFVDSTFCPFICDPVVEGREGFVIDILRDALATQNHTMNFTIVPYKRALSMVRSGEAHALPDIYKEDAPDLITGKSILRLGNNQFFTRNDSSWKYTSADSWKKIIIGVVDGYTFADKEFDQYLESQKHSQNSRVLFIGGEQAYNRLITLLLNKRIDAILDDNAFIQYELARFNRKNSKDNVFSLVSAATLSIRGQHVVAYSPKHPETAKLLMEIIDPFVINLYLTGKIETYLAPYGIN
jgi:polar amino acid transport system substrate-binding protein